MRGLERRLKRALDIAVAGTTLLVTSPILAAGGLAVWASMGSPILYRQERPGLGGRPFTILKLRTMTNERGVDGKLLPDHQRLTVAGRWIRATSIDEIPQLFNVLRGEMSIVGPRPLLTRYLDRYTPRQARRHEVPPGITGWAQVNGRNAISWEEKLELDVWYVEHWSLRLDIQIMWKTALAVLRRDGVSPRDAELMPEFMGTPERA